MKNIGIIGDGQLGRMLALSGIPLGFNFGFLGSKNSPSGNLGQVFSSLEALDNFADVITFESENTSLDIFKNLKTSIYPPQIALKITQNRTLEKALFKQLNIKCANNITINSLNQLHSALDKITPPCIAKTTTQGYDGKGQFVIKDIKDAKDAWGKLGQRELIIEQFIDFDYEISVIATVNANEIVIYPLTKNIHKDGILRTSEVINNSILTTKAQKYINKITQELDYIGTIAVEFFVKGDDLIANEIAPRVHNSGHWSIDGAHTSQFENHIRAITNLPLGSTKTIFNHIMMENIISELPNITQVLENDDAFLHLYDKFPRKNRKIGHINFCKN